MTITATHVEAEITTEIKLDRRSIKHTAIIEQRYKALGGTIHVFHKPSVGHHPHGLDDPTPVVDLIKTYTLCYDIENCK